MKMWLKRPPEERRGVVISGAYGMDNAGDEAVLQAITAALGRLDAQAPVTVICRHARAGAGHGIGRLNVLSWLRAMGQARLFLLGGGSLLQDVTSRRSLWYYLLVMRAAKTMGCAVQCYGVGAGPIRREKDQKRTAEYLNLYADAVTVRDGESLQTLRDWGVTKPRLLLGADPALGLPRAEGGREPKAGFVLRPWPEFWALAPDFAAAARYAWERYRLRPVFLCLAPEDRRAVRAVCEYMRDVPYAVAADARRVGRMAVVVSMRLHGLVFALRDGAPAAGVSYDPKVSAFCREAGLPWVALEQATEENLRSALDDAMHLEGEALSVALGELREREKTNVRVAAQLLAEE